MQTFQNVKPLNCPTGKTMSLFSGLIVTSRSLVDVLHLMKLELKPLQMVEAENHSAQTDALPCVPHAFLLEKLQDKVHHRLNCRSCRQGWQWVSPYCSSEHLDLSIQETCMLDLQPSDQLHHNVCTLIASSSQPALHDVARL